MAALGMFVFELTSLPYQELQRRNEWRHAANTRVGARDALQFVGPGEERISLTGSAHAELMDGAASLETLREMADQGDAVPFVDGAGKVWGNYVLCNVDEHQSHFFADGTPRSIEFGIEMMLVDADASSAGGQAGAA